MQTKLQSKPLQLVSPAEQRCKDLSRAHRQRKTNRQREFEQIGVAARVALRVLVYSAAKTCAVQFGSAATQAAMASKAGSMANKPQT
jgi:hypothetical protein